MILSVIIPTCNRIDLLEQCLKCLLPEIQELESNSYEVIVTDDGKDNRSQELINQKYAWVKWIRGPQRGPASNRNCGAKQAKGNWLIFLDDDCLPENDILKQYIKYIKENPAIKVFEGKITAVGKSTSPLEYAPINLHGGFLWSCNFAILNQFFKSINGFDENFRYPHMEDVDLKDRIVKTGNVIIFAVLASVAHPWRKLTDGHKLGMYQEMYIYYRAKRKMEISLFTLLVEIAKVHLKLVRKAIFSIDVFMAFKVMFQHIFTVVTHYQKWKRIYVAKC